MRYPISYGRTPASRACRALSQDMRELEASDSPAARDAIAYFVSRIRRELAGLAATVNGAEAIVFTAGIGEHSWKVREAALKDMEWMGVHLDARSEPRQCSDHQRQEFADDRLRDPDQRGADDRRAHGAHRGRRQIAAFCKSGRGSLTASNPSAARAARQRACSAAMSESSSGARRSNTTALTPFSRWKTSPVRRNFAPIPCPVSISRDGTMTVC